MKKTIMYLRETVDRTTGEVQTCEKIETMKLPSEPDFIKLYVSDLGRLLDLPQSQSQLLMCLVRLMDYDGIIALTPTRRDRVCMQIGISAKTLRNQMTMMLQHDGSPLRHLGRSEYQMDPHLIAKGHWDDIVQRRMTWEMTVRYTPDGKRQISAKAIPEQFDLLAAE